MGSRGALDKGKGKNMGKKINPFTYQRTCRIQIVTVRGMGRSQDWLSHLDSNTICLLRGPTKAQLKKLQFVIVINNLFIIRDYQCRLSHDVVTSNVDGDVRLHTVSTYAVGKFNQDGSCVMQISLQDTQTVKIHDRLQHYRVFPRNRCRCRVLFSNGSANDLNLS